MRTPRKRSVLAALLVVAASLGGLAVATPAQAQPVTSGTLAFSGDPGDYISGGGSYSYDTAKGDLLNVSASSNTTVSVSLSGANGDWWTLDFDAPTGQALTPGTTYTATRYPFNGAGAGMDLSGNGRGCNTLTATFTVDAASFGENGYVETFDATFEQHCEGFEAAARGKVHIANPPPPAPLSVGATVDASGTVSTVSGRATISGTVTCNRPVTVNLTGTLTQVVRREIVRGPISRSVACTPGTAATWSAIVTPSGTRPFVRGRAEADVQGVAFDDIYNRNVSTSVTVVTTLEKSTAPES